jgi:outer membrane protein assembly factor BamB
VSGGLVYFGSEDHNIYALDAATGAVRWSKLTGERVNSSPAISSNVIYVGSWDGNLYALDAASGNLVWKTPIGGIHTRPAVSDNVVYVSSEDGSCYAVGAGDGRVRWQLPGAGGSDPAVSGVLVYVESHASDGYLYAIVA